MEINRRQLIAGATLALAGVVAVPSIGCSTTWITVAIADLPVVVGIVQSVLAVVLTITDPALLSIVPIITQAGNAVEATLVTLQQLVVYYKSYPSTSVIVEIDTALTAVQKNLSAILAAAHIDNVAIQVMISSGVSLAIFVIQGIQALIPSVLPTGVASLKKSSIEPRVSRVGIAAGMNTPVMLLTGAQIKANYNLIAVAAGYSQHQVQ